MEDEDNRDAFFDQFDEEDDVMPGVPEAEEEGSTKKKSDEPKKVKITRAGKPRFVLNETVLTGKNGLGTVLNHFKVNCFSRGEIYLKNFILKIFRAQNSQKRKILNMKTWIYFYRDLNHGHINYFQNGQEKLPYKKLKC